MLTVVWVKLKALEEAVGKESTHLKGMDRIREVRVVEKIPVFYSPQLPSKGSS